GGARRREWKSTGARVTALYADPQETIWVATDRQVLRLVDGKPSIVPLPASVGPIETITSDGDRGVWLYDVEGGLLHWVDGRAVPLESPVDLHRVRVLSAYTDRAGRVWFALSNGQILRIAESGRAEMLGKADGLDAGIYDAFTEDERGTLWLGASAGISQFADGRFRTLHASKTFPATGIVSIA